MVFSVSELMSAEVIPARVPTELEGDTLIVSSFLPLFCVTTSSELHDENSETVLARAKVRAIAPDWKSFPFIMRCVKGLIMLFIYLLIKI